MWPLRHGQQVRGRGGMAARFSRPRLRSSMTFTSMRGQRRGGLGDFALAARDQRQLARLQARIADRHEDSSPRAISRSTPIAGLQRDAEAAPGEIDHQFDRIGPCPLHEAGGRAFQRLLERNGRASGCGRREDAFAGEFVQAKRGLLRRNGDRVCTSAPMPSLDAGQAFAPAVARGHRRRRRSRNRLPRPRSKAACESAIRTSTAMSG